MQGSSAGDVALQMRALQMRALRGSFACCGSQDGFGTGRSAMEQYLGWPLSVI